MNKKFTLTSKRLTLCPISIYEAKRLTTIINNQEIAQFTFIPYPYKFLYAQSYILHLNSYRMRKRELTFAIFINNFEFIGAISIKPLNGVPSIGYWIGKKYWNHGYCTEALNTVIEFTKVELNITKININHQYKNYASQKVIEKAGFTYFKDTVITHKRKQVKIKCYSKSLCN